MTDLVVPRKPRMRALVAGLVALTLALFGVVAGAVPANAATGVTTSVLQNGSPLQPNAEIKTGDNLKLQVQYTQAAAGQAVTITLAPGVTFSGSFPANEAVESVVATPDGTGVTVTFKDAANWPAGITQGILGLDLAHEAVTESAPGVVGWNDGTEHTIPVVYVKNGDTKQNVSEGYAKAVNPTNLNGFVLKDGDGNYQGINPAITGQTLTYTLTVSVPAGATYDDYEVSDLLPDGLGYVTPIAVTASERTWDVNGYNPSTAPRTFTVDSSTSDTFSGHIAGTITGPSITTLTYTVRVDDVAALGTALQAAFDARNGAAGGYSIALRNTATFGPLDKTAQATVSMGGTVAGPCVTCGDLTKTGDLTTVTGLTQPDGTLLSPVPLTYTFHASLARWDAHSANFTLTKNVVIEDDLISQASWNSGAGWLTSSGTGPALTSAGTCPATTADFQADTYIGQYCVTGQKLLINVGRTNTTDLTIVAHATLNTVAGLPTDGTVADGSRYRVSNTATFRWNDTGAYTTPPATGYVIVPTADGTGVTDASAFAKTAPAKLSAVPGEPLQVPFTFTVNSARTGTPAATSTIVDHVDTRYFVLPADLGTLPISGGYAGGVSLVAADFALTRSGDDLTIALSASGKAKVAAPNGILTVNLTLTTRAFDGKETVDITNSADLYGQGDGAHFASRVTTQGSSYGAEAEARKHVYDHPGQEWTQVLVPDADGEPVYVYRLQFIGHPGFGNVAIDPEQDVLPDNLEFIGFVTEANVATGDGASAAPYDTTEGNLVATFDGTAGPRGTITLSQRPATTFPDGATANVYFAARLVDPKKQVVNEFGGSTTTIVPGGPSIDIEKWTDEGGTGPQYDEYGALTNDGYAGDFDAAPGKTLTAGVPQTIRFTVSNDGPEALVDVVVSDELDSGYGTITGLVCTFPGADGESPILGTEWAGPFAPGARFDCEGTLPALAAGQSHADTASVHGVGQVSGIAVQDADEWHGTVPAAAVVVAPLATTGGRLAVGVLGAGALGILVGAVLLAVRRRRQGA